MYLLKKAVLSLLVICSVFLPLNAAFAVEVNLSPGYGSFENSVDPGWTIEFGSVSDGTYLDGGAWYAYVPDGLFDYSWARGWTDGDGDSNRYQGVALGSQSFLFLNSSYTWSTLTSLDWSTSGAVQANINANQLRWLTAVTITFDDAFNSFVMSGWAKNKGETSLVAVNEIFTRRATPIPGAVWLLGSGLAGLVGMRRRMKK